MSARRKRKSFGFPSATVGFLRATQSEPKSASSERAQQSKKKHRSKRTTPREKQATSKRTARDQHRWRSSHRCSYSAQTQTAGQREARWPAKTGASRQPERAQRSNWPPRCSRCTDRWSRTRTQDGRIEPERRTDSSRTASTSWRIAARVATTERATAAQVSIKTKTR